MPSAAILILLQHCRQPAVPAAPGRNAEPPPQFAAYCAAIAAALSLLEVFGGLSQMRSTSDPSVRAAADA